MSIGSLCLVINSYYTTRAGRTYGTPMRIYVNGLGVILCGSLSTSHLTVIKGYGAVTCYFVTARTGTPYTLYTSSMNLVQIYYK